MRHRLEQVAACDFVPYYFPAGFYCVELRTVRWKKLYLDVIAKTREKFASLFRPVRRRVVEDENVFQRAAKCLCKAAEEIYEGCSVQFAVPLAIEPLSFNQGPEHVLFLSAPPENAPRLCAAGGPDRGKFRNEAETGLVKIDDYGAQIGSFEFFLKFLLKLSRAVLLAFMCSGRGVILLRPNLCISF